MKPAALIIYNYYSDDEFQFAIYYAIFDIRRRLRLRHASKRDRSSDHLRFMNQLYILSRSRSIASSIVALAAQCDSLACDHYTQHVYVVIVLMEEIKRGARCERACSGCRRDPHDAMHHIEDALQSDGHLERVAVALLGPPPPP